MDQFRNIGVILVSLLLCFGLTDGAIAEWELDSGAAVSGANVAFAVTVAETNDVTLVFFTLTATATAGRAIVKYEITNEETTGQFKIGDVNDADVGEFKLNTGECLDYELGSTIVIEVTATDDTAGTGLIGVATVTITITDVTTYVPVFTTPSTATTCVEIPDQAAVNDAVITVVDADAGANTVTYSIASGNTDTDFAIDGTSGAITVAKVLDKARIPCYWLVVYGTNTASTTCDGTGSVLVEVSVGKPCPCCEDADADNGAGTAAVSVITLMTGIFLFELM